MFEMITRAPEGSELSARTRAAVISTGISQIATACRELATVAPQMSQVQRNLVRLAMCDAIKTLDEVEDVAGRVIAALRTWPRLCAEERERAVQYAEAIRADGAAS